MGAQQPLRESPKEGITVPKPFFIGSNLPSRAACLHLGPGSRGTGLTEGDKPRRSAGHVTTAASAQPLAGSGSTSTPTPGEARRDPGLGGHNEKGDGDTDGDPLKPPIPSPMSLARFMAAGGARRLRPAATLP